ncbi:MULTISPECIES: hypothetical protein [Protofrankia]|uniref:Uncharacterized protein n=1 Tax=Candidatus Protofrankia datiscae TaxID=2716812 RepID=F8B247_9ACTN|nr:MULTISPECIES: hypothetical protein [Protofrankia]AEH08924.1 hypothetical protein FsymDg_1457 [Candidatus Protofrankia datiscae]
MIRGPAEPLDLLGGEGLRVASLGDLRGGRYVFGVVSMKLVKVNS